MQTKKPRRRGRNTGEGGFRFLEAAAAWSRVRNPWLRIPFMFYGVHFIMLSAVSLKTEAPRTIFSRIFSMVDFGFSWLNLGFHEIGHIVFSPLGMFMGILGGSLLQCLVPLLSTIMFYRQRDFFWNRLLLPVARGERDGCGSVRGGCANVAA
ncbi:MAG: hypothetical protein IIB38_17570 [Candidatus Hydrogenedentes bacterium]|nr:hypothetical protein [Candidatus Hydrogenedentota bacterium]